MSCSDSPHYQFFFILSYNCCSALQTKRRFDKNMNVLAAELRNISPAAYRMLRNCGSVVLPRVKLIKQLLSKSFHDQNDEVKLTETLRYLGGRVVGYAEDVVTLKTLLHLRK